MRFRLISDVNFSHCLLPYVVIQYIILLEWRHEIFDRLPFVFSSALIEAPFEHTNSIWLIHLINLYLFPVEPERTQFIGRSYSESSPKVTLSLFSLWFVKFWRFSLKWFISRWAGYRGKHSRLHYRLFLQRTHLLWKLKSTCYTMCLLRSRDRELMD